MLTALCIGSNDFSGPGQPVKALAELLTNNTVLRSLSLNYDGVNKDHVQAFIKAVQGSTTLKRLRLDGNDLEPIECLLGCNQGLKIIDVSSVYVYGVDSKGFLVVVWLRNKVNSLGKEAVKLVLPCDFDFILNNRANAECNRRAAVKITSLLRNNHDRKIKQRDGAVVLITSLFRNNHHRKIKQRDLEVDSWFNMMT